jgi:hypothetical protein
VMSAAVPAALSYTNCSMLCSVEEGVVADTDDEGRRGSMYSRHRGTPYPWNRNRRCSPLKIFHVSITWESQLGVLRGP